MTINKRGISEGTIVRHFKFGNLYKVLYFAINTRIDNSEDVVYQELHPPYRVFTRSVDEFFSFVDTDKYPSAKQLYRLEKITDCPDKPFINPSNSKLIERIENKDLYTYLHEVGQNNVSDISLFNKDGYLLYYNDGSKEWILDSEYNIFLNKVQLFNNN